MWLVEFGTKAVAELSVWMGYNRAVMQKVMRQFEASYDREAEQ